MRNAFNENIEILFSDTDCGKCYNYPMDEIISKLNYQTEIREECSEK